MTGDLRIEIKKIKQKEYLQDKQIQALQQKDSKSLWISYSSLQICFINILLCLHTIKPHIKTYIITLILMRVFTNKNIAFTKYKTNKTLNTKSLFKVLQMY